MYKTLEQINRISAACVCGRMEIDMNTGQAKKVLSNFHRLELGTFPTPLHQMNNIRKKTGAPFPLYIKRDDLTGLGAGGNKIRNLEYLLGDAVQRRADVVIASGKCQSNLCSLAVSACSKADLDCVMIHNDDKPERAEGNQLLNSLSGADMRFIGDMPDREREKYVEQFCRELEEQNRHPYVIRNGASTALGSLGYVQAVVELCEQCAGRGIEIKHLFVPGGNGGLAAGVIFGTALVEAPFHVHVVTVEHEKQELQEILCGFIRDLQELTGSLAGASFDDLYTIHEEYRGEGWGIPTPESVDWIHDLARTEGIFVEKVYTSKTLYGMLDLIQKGSIDGSACYLHSGGFGALFSQFETL